MATETFTAFVTGTPVATTPGALDYIPLIQGGVTKKLPGTAIGSTFTSAPSNVFTPITNDAALSSLTTFLVNTATTQNSTPEFAAAFCLTAATGTSFSASSQKTALYAGALANAGSYSVDALRASVQISAANGTTVGAVAGAIHVVNLNADADGSTKSYLGLLVKSDGGFRATDAVQVVGPFFNGLHVTGASTSQASFYDQSSAAQSILISGGVYGNACIKFTGAQSFYGLDFVGVSALIQAAIRLTPNSGSGPNSIVTRNIANNNDFVMIESIGFGGATGVQLGGGDAQSVLCASHFLAGFSFSPVWDIGNPGGEQWRTVYCVNVVQSSGEATKDIVGPAPDVGDIIDALDINLYRMKVGGADPVQDFEEKTVPVMRMVPKTTLVTQLVDGVARQVPQTVEVEEPVYEEHAVIGGDGKPVMQVVPAVPPIVDPVTRAIAHPGTPAFTVPLVHRELVTQTVRAPIVKQVPRPGKRLHFGPTAANIRDAFSKHGVDYAAYKAGENGYEGYQVDQALWIAIAEIKSLRARVAALESQTRH